MSFLQGINKVALQLVSCQFRECCCAFVEHAVTPACVCEYSPLMSIYAYVHLHLVCCLLCRKDGGVHVAHSGAPALPTSWALDDTGPGPGAYTGTRSAGVPSGETTLPVHQNHHVSCCRYVCSHSDNDSVEREKENAVGCQIWQYTKGAEGCISMEVCVNSRLTDIEMANRRSQRRWDKE